MNIFKLGSILITVLHTYTGCMETSNPQVNKGTKTEVASKDATSDERYTPYQTPDPLVNDPVTISCNSCVSTVKLNQSTTWQFSAVTASGKIVEINNITSVGSINDFVVAGPIVKFTPKQSSELNGSLKVDAISNGRVYSQSFSWGGISSGGNGEFLKTIGGVLVQVLANTGSGEDDEEYDDSEDY